MRRKSKNVRVLILFVLISVFVAGNFSLFKNQTSAATQDLLISNVVVTPYPNTASALASYTINFTLSGALNAQTAIQIKNFSAGYPLPTNSSLISNVLVNGAFAYCNVITTTSPIILRIVLSQAVNTNNVTITINSGAGIYNPSQGTYQLSVQIEGLSTEVQSSPYSIGQGGISGLSASVTPNLVNSYARYNIAFKTSYTGALTANTDAITVRFPTGTVLPASIAPSYITINGVICTYNPVVSQTANTVVITIPLNITYNYDVTVIISELALIQNPSVASNYTIVAYTSKDTNAITSNYYTIASSSVTKPSVTVAPSTVQSAAKYEISFKVSSTGALTAGSDKIIITFPQTTYIPSYITSSGITVNNVVCSTVARGPLDLQLTITAPVSVANSGNVNIVISDSFGIKNPVNTGNYTLKVHTNKDPSDVESNSFSIGSSKISNVSVTVTPSIQNASATYVVQFLTGSAGALSSGDKVILIFPSGTTLPTSILPSYVTVNGTVPLSVASDTYSRKITITVSSSVLPQQTVVVTLLSNASVKNPSAGSYTLSVSTSKEPDPVSSSSYTIYGLPETLVSVEPSTPNGKNGYYITEPRVTLSLKSSGGLTATIYYRVDSGAVTKYTAPFTIPEGNHTLYYHCEDPLGNKESEKSMSFNVDLTPPELTIVSPKDGDTFHVNTFTLSGSVAKESKVSVNDSSLVVTADGLFSYSGVFTTEGKNIFNVVAEDTAGNKTVKTITLIYVKRVNVIMQVGNKYAYVNGQQIAIDAPPFVLNGRTMVPLRFLSQIFNAEVSWDPIFEIVTVKLGNKTIRVQVGNKIYDNNGKKGTLDALPVIKNGFTFVPLRLFIEAFGGDVVWDSKMQIINITYPKP